MANTNKELLDILRSRLNIAGDAMGVWTVDDIQPDLFNEVAGKLTKDMIDGLAATMAEYTRQFLDQPALTRRILSPPMTEEESTRMRMRLRFLENLAKTNPTRHALLVEELNDGS